MAESPTSTQVTFINFSSPSDFHRDSARKKIRSHVTGRQHARLRQQNLRQALSEPQQHASEQLEEQHEEASMHNAAGTAASACLSRTAGSPFETAFSEGSLAFRTFALEDNGNVTGPALEDLDLDASSSLKFYRHIVYVQARDIQRQNGLDPDTTQQDMFMAFMSSDPALVAMAIVVAAQSLRLSSGLAMQSHQLCHIFQLRVFLISRVNVALSDPRRALCNQMLVCISLLATSAAKYEDPKIYHMHMSGLMQMVRLRGGLVEIGKQTPWVERLLLWHDVNSSSIVGTSPHFSNMVPSSTGKRPVAHRQIFTVNAKT